MEALGALSPVETARAKLQEKVADFLAARARLIRLQNNPSLQIQGQAKGLYAVQVTLEDQLQRQIYPKINAITSGGQWEISDVLLIGGFTTNIIKQINDVNGLEAQAGGVVPSSTFDPNTMMIGVLVLAVVAGFGGYAFGRR